jgi:D-xylose transport system substrate-binding protein
MNSRLGAYVMNDGMANTVIAALKAVGLAGKVLVTGQNATVAGIRNILLGTQSMTVYKPIEKLADSVGQLPAAMSSGTSTSALANQQWKNPDGIASIPSVLNAGVEVDISNIKTTVVADGFVAVADICQGVPSGVGGVCP